MFGSSAQDTVFGVGTTNARGGSMTHTRTQLILALLSGALAPPASGPGPTVQDETAVARRRVIDPRWASGTTESRPRR